jgi:hypothetical protein
LNVPIIELNSLEALHWQIASAARNREASYADPNGAIDAAVKAKLDNYQHDYLARNFLRPS